MRSFVGLACVWSLVAGLAAGCQGEVEKETLRCGNRAGLVEPSFVQAACEQKCAIEDCREGEVEQQACLEDCRDRSRTSHGALWLIWQQCRVENSCDGVFENSKCERFEGAYLQCACEAYAICNPAEPEVPPTAPSECRRRLEDSTCGQEWADYSSCLIPSPRCIECEEYCENATCDFCDPRFCAQLCEDPDACAPRCGEEACLELLQAWDDCIHDADAARVVSACGAACGESCLGQGPDQILCVNECSSSSAGSTCRLSTCWDSAAEQTQCLSNCKSRGEQSGCGDSWLTWQECRVESSCDGAFEIENCRADQDGYYGCACEGIVGCELVSEVECEGRLTDEACGASWAAYTTCVASLANCESCPEPYTGAQCPSECQECCALMDTWQQCAIRDERVEATCRAACTEECRGAASDEMSCLRACKDNGEDVWCGAAWLTLQECRVANRCDGVFATDACEDLKESYDECAMQWRSGQ